MHEEQPGRDPAAPYAVTGAVFMLDPGLCTTQRGRDWVRRYPGDGVSPYRRP